MSSIQEQSDYRWEQRWHPLLREWVILAAHRQERPWSGDDVAADADEAPDHDPQCFLCPGNRRVSGLSNPDYDGTFVFDNDHPCIGPDAPSELRKPEGIYRNSPATGIARVVCYTPLHNRTLAELSRHEVESLVRVWQQQYRDLRERSGVRNVMIFENKGAVCGVSNPHAHGQIYATNFRHKNIMSHVEAARDHKRETGRILFQDILDAELREGARIVYENETAVVLVPYFGRFAYEGFVAPRRTCPSVADLSDAEAADLADALLNLVVRYDNLWKQSMPYMMALHQAPTDGADYSAFHFHIQFYPPLRKPGLLKYVAAIETGGGNFVSDTMPEEKAAELRALSAIHYKAAN